MVLILDCKQAVKELNCIGISEKLKSRKSDRLPAFFYLKESD